MILAVDWLRQGRHIPGHADYDAFRSTLVAGPAELLAAHAGKGDPANATPRGEPGVRERFDTRGEVIGIYRDPQTGLQEATTRGIIHYSSRGAHIVPARPRPGD